MGDMFFANVCRRRSRDVTEGLLRRSLGLRRRSAHGAKGSQVVGEVEEMEGQRGFRWREGLEGVQEVVESGGATGGGGSRGYVVWVREGPKGVQGLYG